jgi:repressor LexA
MGKRIKAAREKKGYSQSELAELLGYKSRSSINKIETDGRDIPRSSIVKFAKILDVTPSYLMGWDDEQLQLYDEYENIEPVTTKKYPVLGKIACGEPIFCDYTDTYVETSSNLNADFCLICKGDSMINARIYDGDAVFIKSQPIVNNGEIAAVAIGEEATLKRVYYYEQQHKIVLIAENSKYEPLVYVNEELENIRILGKAIAFMSNIK